jgi:hypothetical protein
MPWTNPGAPNLTDFTEFVGSQFSSSQLPANSPWIGYALDFAQTRVSNAPCVPGVQYTLAVYQLGLHWLIKWTPDEANQTAFQTARNTYGLLGFTGGVISSSTDEGTTQSFAVAEGLKDLTLDALDCLKTPWGRGYLAYQQQHGPRVFGVS